jgi:uncharacterized protein (DUF433 family)
MANALAPGSAKRLRGNALFVSSNPDGGDGMTAARVTWRLMPVASTSSSLRDPGESAAVSTARTPEPHVPVLLLQAWLLVRNDDEGESGHRPKPTGSLISMTFTRITVSPDQMGGVPCIRGLRVPVSAVVDMVADGMSTPEILEAYPDLEADDVTEALRYAAEAVRERELPLAAAG